MSEGQVIRVEVALVDVNTIRSSCTSKVTSVSSSGRAGARKKDTDEPKEDSSPVKTELVEVKVQLVEELEEALIVGADNDDIDQDIDNVVEEVEHAKRRGEVRFKDGTVQEAADDEDQVEGHVVEVVELDKGEGAIPASSDEGSRQIPRSSVGAGGRLTG